MAVSSSKVRYDTDKIHSLPWWEASERSIKQIKEELYLFYQEHSPHKLKGLPMMLKKYEGQERKLLELVKDKYERDGIRSELVALYLVRRDLILSGFFLTHSNT